MAGFNHDSRSIRLGEERIEYGPGAIGVREELTVLFLVQAYAQSLEKARGALSRERTQHMAHDARGPAPERPFPSCSFAFPVR